jgi:carbamoyl-phosphate synthase large subunit
MAYAKSQFAASSILPKSGLVFISVAKKDHEAIMTTAQTLVNQGFQLVGTAGTVKALESKGIKSETIQKVQHGSPNVLDLMEEGKLSLICMTPSVKGRSVEGEIRQKALLHDIPVYTTISGAEAAANAIALLSKEEPGVCPLQEL